MNPAYYDLLNTIKDRIETKETKNILRLGIYGLGSPLWFSESSEKDSLADLTKFFYCLRGLLKQSKVAAMITIPSHLYEQVRVLRLYFVDLI